MVALGSSSAQAEESADASVQLRYTGLLGMQGHFQVSITNNGSSPVQSATVTLHAVRFLLTASSPCTNAFNYPDSTLTCQFGALPVGATATVNAFPGIIFNGSENPTQHLLTLTRVASTPADPNPTNDTATRTCRSWDSGSPLQEDLLFC